MSDRPHPLDRKKDPHLPDANKKLRFVTKGIAATNQAADQITPSIAQALVSDLSAQRRSRRSGEGRGGGGGHSPPPAAPRNEARRGVAWVMRDAPNL